MAWTSVGFDGTITEIQWAGMASLLGNGYVAAGNGDCLVTAVPGARSVSVAAGSLYGDGVLSTNSGAETVAMTTPVNGQWYVIALRRTWATNTAALVAIAGATTTTTTPTAPPTSFPTLNTNVGVLTDQPIAWAWCNSANTTVVVYDIRLKPVKSLPPVVATQAERDAKFMSPTQGLQVWRDDLGAVETYYGLYNASTNPGGRNTAGWYTTERSGGLVPVKPAAITIATGTGSFNALGVVSFSGATAIQLDGVFTSNYKNYYIEVNYEGSSTSTGVYARMASGGTPDSGSNYYYTFLYNSTGGASGLGGVGSTSVDIGVIYNNGTAPGHAGASIEIRNPQTSNYTNSTFRAINSRSGTVEQRTGGFHTSTTTSYDGIYLYVGAGNITGTIQVFGYVNK